MSTIKVDPSLLTDCEVTIGRNGRLTCVLNGYDPSAPAAAVKAISAALPNDFVMVSAPAPFLPSWVRQRDYMTVLLSATRAGLAMSIEQTIKAPPPSFDLDGNVTPVPIITGKVEGGSATRMQVATGVVVGADATHSYVVGVIPAAVLGAIRVGNPFAVTPRAIWRLEKPTVLARDDPTNLTLLSVDKLRITPATFSHRTRELEDVRVYYFSGAPGDVAPSLDSDWVRDVSSDEGVIRVLHTSPPGFDFSDDRGGSSDGSLVIDKETHLVVGIADKSGRTTTNMWFGASAAPIVALAAKAHLTLAFGSDEQSSGMAISNVPTPATMFVRRSLPSIARVVVEDSVGSGVVVARAGSAAYILTAAQLLKKKTSATVYFSNATKGTRATLVRTDPKSDLALLRVDGLNVPSVGLARTVLPGLDIGIVVFDANDAHFSATPHLAEGVVNSIDDAHGTFEHDAPVDDGNVGGPIFELSTGALVGLVEGQPTAGDFVGISLAPIRRLLSGLAGM
ncbi:MAG TPA: serine protease [Candidatus Acidoferrales bacterium]|nr:serine protease [Candidatus Acidoferrales bacterium]